MKPIVLIDTNIVLRHLRGDHEILSPQAKTIFAKAQKDEYHIYIDEIVIAEVVWTLTSLYREKKADIVTQLRDIISQNWIVNPRKELILKSLTDFSKNNLSYIDCWIYHVKNEGNYDLKTFDKDLKKFHLSS